MLCDFAAFAQQDDIDLLESIIKQNPRNSAQVDAHADMASLLYDSDPKKARKQGEDAIELAKSINYSDGLDETLMLVGNIHAVKLDRYDRAIEFYKEAYNLKKIKFEQGQISEEDFKSSMNVISQRYQELANKPDLKKRERIAADEYRILQGTFTDFMEEKVRIAEEKLDVLAEDLKDKIKEQNIQNRKNLKLSKNNYKLSTKVQSLIDSLLEEQMAQSLLVDSLRKRELRLKTEQLRLQIEKNKVYQQESELSKLEQAKAEQRTKLYSFGIALFLTIIIVIIVLFNIGRLKKLNGKLKKLNGLLNTQKNELYEQNEEIQQQKEEIESQRDLLEGQKDVITKQITNITASINYAQRIQQAILPSENKIGELLPESFVLFKPRDIVSGDFFWVNQVEGKVIVAAIDCTGHGVPGAFMSMIGDTILDQLILQKRITAPDQILTELNKQVVEVLKQEESNNKDGMDMAICVIDKDNNKIDFAGAKNPLVYIQNGEVHRIKGDKHPIGGHLFNKETRTYTKHTVPLNTGILAGIGTDDAISEDQATTIYLFSDGYQDQTGGPNSRKFMSKTFREYLFELHRLPMSEQKEILNTKIEEWMAESKQEQVDDILVMGVRV